MRSPDTDATAAALVTSSKKEVVSIEIPLLMGFSEETLVVDCEYDVTSDVVTIL